jgi:pimeloyl-ACP methyl ester carboxylesterase
LARLAARTRLVAHDRFGTGLSPGPVEDFTLEASVREVEAVLDALGEGRVALLGISASGPIAVALAVRRPDLVSHLVLLGTYARGTEVFGRRDQFESILGLVRSHWGLGSKLLTDLMYPSATREFARLFARGQREAASAEVAAGYLEAMFDADVSSLLGRVTAPALVIHYTGDRAIPFAGGRSLAAGLPGARFVPLGGSLHLPEGEDAVRVAAEVIAFIC